MPTMNLSGDEFIDVGRTFSYMYFPDNEEKRKDFLFILKMLDDLDSHISDVICFKKTILDRLLNSSSPEQISNEMSHNFHKGCYQVGCILHNLLCLEATDSQKASLNIAIEFTKNQSKAIMSTYHDSKIKKLTSASYWGYWKKYKSVSHLWGTYISLSINDIKSTNVGNVPFRTFLLESERYRLLGEQHIDKRTKKPALPLGECWTPPADYLPEHSLRPFHPGTKPDL